MACILFSLSRISLLALYNPDCEPLRQVAQKTRPVAGCVFQHKLGTKKSKEGAIRKLIGTLYNESVFYFRVCDRGIFISDLIGFGGWGGGSSSVIRHTR